MQGENNHVRDRKPVSYQLLELREAALGTSAVPPSFSQSRNYNELISGRIIFSKTRYHLHRAPLFQRQPKEGSAAPSDLKITFLLWSRSQLASPSLLWKAARALYQLAIPPTLLLGFPGDAARYVVPEPPCSALLSQQPAMPCVLVKASRLLLGLSIPAKFADGSGFGLTHRIPPQPPAEVGNLHLLAFQLSGLPARLRSCSPATSLSCAQGRLLPGQ